MGLKRLSRAELGRRLLAALGLAGPLWQGRAGLRRIEGLGMVQLDSIRVCGLRNQELALLARSEDPAHAYPALAYGRRSFLELHYPVHAVRRDWAAKLALSGRDLTPEQRAKRLALQEVMAEVEALIAEAGPVAARGLASERIPGGFATVKRTTQALEYLWEAGRLLIAHRGANFDRHFDLAPRVAPDFAESPLPSRAEYERFLVASALSVLKIATAGQLARRVKHHYGERRPGLPLSAALKLVERELPALGAVEVRVKDADLPPYYALPEALKPAPSDPGPLRVLPPLDNLLFSRQRFADLFDRSFLFEAYKPQAERRFYYALPLAYDGRILGTLDAKLEGEVWRIRRAELQEPPPGEALRQGLARVAAAAGASRIESARGCSRAFRRLADGAIEGTA